VVGAGAIADVHLEVLAGLPGVEIVAVCDPDLPRAERAARRFSVPRATRDVAELPSDAADVAHVLVQPDLHAPVARACLERGLSVFLEKPLAPSLAEARDLASFARERSLVLAVNHNTTFHPAFLRALRALERGFIGRLEHVSVVLSVPLRQLAAGEVSHWMFREPKNILFEQAVHPFSQLAELLGPVESLDLSILATRELEPGRVFCERMSIAARAEGGTAALELAFGSPFPVHTLRLHGTDGMIEVDLHHDACTIERKTVWPDFWNSFLALSRRARALRAAARRNLVDHARLVLGLGERRGAFFEGMRASIEAFHAALRAGTAPPAGPEQALVVLEWCERAAAHLPRAPERPLLRESSTPPRPGEIAVLGANGFIGRATIAALLARGLPTTAVLRRLEGMPELFHAAARDGRLRIRRASLTDEESLRHALSGVTTVLHLATGGGSTWEDYERAMVRGTKLAAEIAFEQGSADEDGGRGEGAAPPAGNVPPDRPAQLAPRGARFLFVSSTAALYLGRDAPGLGAHGELADDTEPDPRPEGRAPYARGKITAENELRRLARERGLRLTIVRPAIVVGRGAPLQHGGLGLWVRDNHCVGWGRGDRPLPLVLVEDVADALALLCAFPGTELDGKRFQLASAARIGARELVAEYVRRTGRDFHFHPRALLLSKAIEAVKWLVKRLGGRRDPFPSWRDMQSRELYPVLACETARTVLGWKPCDDRAELLDRFLGPLSGEAPAKGS